MTALAVGFGISRATGYRYRDEVITVLAAQAPDLHEALQQVADEGWSHVILDGKVFPTDRCAETTTSAKGATIHSWYSGKHRAFGGNVQAIMRPDGHPIWTCEVIAGHHHDMTAARDAHLLGALYWAASQPGLPTFADGGYHGAGQGIHVPYKQPANGNVPGRRSSGLQRAAARPTSDGRTRLRPAIRTLACPAPHHRQPLRIDLRYSP
jgi:DDE superfamily endonuclease